MYFPTHGQRSLICLVKETSLFSDYSQNSWLYEMLIINDGKRPMTCHLLRMTQPWPSWTQELCLLARDPHKSGPPIWVGWVLMGPYRFWKRNNIQLCTHEWAYQTLLDDSKPMITQMVSVKSVGHQPKVMNMEKGFIKKGASMGGEKYEWW